MATLARIDLGDGTLVPRIAGVVKECRALVGWSQRELAVRAGVSQSALCRIEAGRATSLDVVVIGRVLTALGLRTGLDIDDVRLADRRRQRDGVHAVMNGFSARRHERDRWETLLEVLIGGPTPRGWIDLLGFRPEDRALLVQETKSDIPDMGALQRSVAFYERSAAAVARAFGWNPVSVTVLVVVLDSEVVARRLRDNRELVARVFPAPVAGTAAWLADPGRPMPIGWTIATCDPASRAAGWLRPTMLGSRRSPPAYRGYADAAARLLRG